MVYYNGLGLVTFIIFPYVFKFIFYQNLVDIMFQLGMVLNGMYLHLFLLLFNPKYLTITIKASCHLHHTSALDTF